MISVIIIFVDLFIIFQLCEDIHTHKTGSGNGDLDPCGFHFRGYWSYKVEKVTVVGVVASIPYQSEHERAQHPPHPGLQKKGV